jgi:photosystem II stability/assembly factor-like uncharacterized protein
MRIAVGTEKGGYLLTETGTGWDVSGPLFPGWKVTAFGRAPSGAHLAALGSNWFGVGIQRSEDFVEWAPVDSPPAWPEGSDRKMEQIWEFHGEGATLLAGVAQAGLFRSNDDGVTWEPVAALNEHPTRDQWHPGAGGLCAHRVLTGPESTWVGISAVGVFRSDDGGASWLTKNDGVPPAGVPDDGERPEVGYCVHGLAHDPADTSRIWRQDHMGVFRSRDGGDNWERIEEGLPAGFGFVMWRHPGTGRLLTIPLESSENRVPVDGNLRVYASDDDGDSWAVAGSGWSDAPQFTGVLRRAFDGDSEGGFCFGTTGGKLWITRDLGEHWVELEPSFPRIAAIKVLD